MQSLEKKFKTIKDLGNVIKCRIHNSETLVSGENVLCDGKRFKISHEAAKDIEIPASTRQEIIQSPVGMQQDFRTALQHGGIYGQPVAAFLGEPYGMQRSNAFLEPHDQYPMLGIYDHGLRSLDSKSTGHKKNKPLLSIKNNNKLTNFNDDNKFDNDYLQEDTETRSLPPSFASKNFNGIELADLNQSLDFDSDEMKEYEDYTNNDYEDDESNDRFYRDSRLQMDALGLNGVNKISNNPFAQYWKGLKTNFYGTTTSQLGELDPSANSLGKIFEKAEMKTKIPTKKSEIQKHLSGQEKKVSIPKPEISKGTDEVKNKEAKKRFMIYRNQQFPMQYYHATPPFNPIQYYSSQPQQRFFNPMYPQYQGNNFFAPINRQYMPDLKTITERGVARSFGTPNYGAWRFQDSYLAGGPFREPLDRTFAQAQSQLVGGEPGHPRRGVMQYGIQPNTRRPPFLGYVPVPIMKAMPMNFQSGGMGYQRLPFQPHSPEETIEQASAFRSTLPREDDASKDYERLTDAQEYLPAPFYKTPMYNPHESENYFPDGTNEQRKDEDDNNVLNMGNSNREWTQQESGWDNGKSSDVYGENMRQNEEEDEGKKRSMNQQETHLDIHGNKLDEAADGRMVFTKEHVGFGPITVEAKTANSAMKDLSDDDRK
eukprot:gene12650-13949_t